MPEYKYDLIDDKGRPIASEMNLDYASDFLVFLMEKYYMKEDISYTIRSHVNKPAVSEIDSMKEDWAEYAKRIEMDQPEYPKSVLKDNPDYPG